MSAIVNSEIEKQNAEVKERWGGTDAYRQYEEKTRDYSEDRWGRLSDETDSIMTEFAACMKKGEKAASVEAQSLVKKLQNHISESYYLCTNEILAGLGQMYVLDERFRNNIDKHGEGTAAFISEAVQFYCG